MRVILIAPWLTLALVGILLLGSLASTAYPSHDQYLLRNHYRVERYYKQPLAHGKRALDHATNDKQILPDTTSTLDHEFHKSEFSSRNDNNKNEIASVLEKSDQKDDLFTNYIAKSLSDTIRRGSASTTIKKEENSVFDGQQQRVHDELQLGKRSSSNGNDATVEESAPAMSLQELLELWGINDTSNEKPVTARIQRGDIEITEPTPKPEVRGDLPASILYSDSRRRNKRQLLWAKDDERKDLWGFAEDDGLMGDQTSDERDDYQQTIKSPNHHRKHHRYNDNQPSRNEDDETRKLREWEEQEKRRIEQARRRYDTSNNRPEELLKKAGRPNGQTYEERMREWRRMKEEYERLANARRNNGNRPDNHKSQEELENERKLQEYIERNTPINAGNRAVHNRSQTPANLVMPGQRRPPQNSTNRADNGRPEDRTQPHSLWFEADPRVVEEERRLSQPDGREGGRPSLPNRREDPRLSQPDRGEDPRLSQPDRGENRRYPQPNMGDNRRFPQPNRGENRRFPQPNIGDDRKSSQPDRGENRRYPQPDRGENRRYPQPDRGENQRYPQPHRDENQRNEDPNEEEKRMRENEEVRNKELARRLEDERRRKLIEEQSKRYEEERKRYEEQYGIKGRPNETKNKSHPLNIDDEYQRTISPNERDDTNKNQPNDWHSRPAPVDDHRKQEGIKRPNDRNDRPTPVVERKRQEEELKRKHEQELKHRQEEEQRRRQEEEMRRTQEQEARRKQEQNLRLKQEESRRRQGEESRHRPGETKGVVPNRFRDQPQNRRNGWPSANTNATNPEGPRRWDPEDNRRRYLEFKKNEESVSWPLLEKQKKNEEEERLRKLKGMPVRAEIIIRSNEVPGGSMNASGTTPPPLLNLRQAIGTEIEFPGLNPNRGVVAPNFPAPPTPRPPAKSPPSCVWAIVVCCKDRRNIGQLSRCFEATDCPGVTSWDPEPCKMENVKAANKEIMHFYLSGRAKF